MTIERRLTDLFNADLDVPAPARGWSDVERDGREAKRRRVAGMLGGAIAGTVALAVLAAAIVVRSTALPVAPPPDPVTGAHVTATIALDGPPTAVAIDQTRDRLYVAVGRSLQVFDTQTNRRTGIIDVPPTGSAEPGRDQRIRCLAIDPELRRAYACLYEDEVSVVDLDSGRVTAGLPIESVATSITVALPTHRLFVARQGRITDPPAGSIPFVSPDGHWRERTPQPIDVFDGSTRERIGRLAPPDGAIFTGSVGVAGDRTYVNWVGTCGATIYDRSLNNKGHIFDRGLGFGRVAATTRRAIGGEFTMLVADISSGDTIAWVNLHTGAAALATDSARQIAWLGIDFAGSPDQAKTGEIVLVDLEDPAILARVPVGTGPRGTFEAYEPGSGVTGFAVNSESGRVYAALEHNRQIVVLDPETGGTRPTPTPGLPSVSSPSPSRSVDGWTVDEHGNRIPLKDPCD